MMNDEKAAAAARIGDQIAREVLERRREAREERAAAMRNRSERRFLAALGDSWFDYPVHNVLERLRDKFGYDIEDAAENGALIEKMAYAGGQIDKFAHCLEKIQAHRAEPTAILLSGGGNDIVGADFGVLLNSASSPIAGWNDEILNGLINERVLTSYHCLICAVNVISMGVFQRTFPIIVHGYDYMVPDGRGLVFHLFSWLQPGFHEKGFLDDLGTNRLLMRDLIDRLNAAMATLAAGNVHFLDLRNTLCGDPHNPPCDYEKSWDNELHPTRDGFEAVAKRFSDLISTLH